jgi:hypothetical protein
MPQSNKISQWLENVYNNKANKEMLYLDLTKTQIPYNQSYLHKLAQTPSSRVNVIFIDGQQVPRYFQCSNLIIVTSFQTPYSLELIKKYIANGVIYVDDINSINKITASLHSKIIDTNTNFNYQLINKIEFEEVLQLDVKDIKEFVINRMILLEKIHYGFQWEHLNYLDDYLNIYHHCKILVANFVQYLYRLATLNFIATVKAVGGAIHKTLGVKSSVISFKSLTVALPMELRKNLRVYNLNENQIRNLKFKKRCDRISPIRISLTRNI